MEFILVVWFIGMLCAFELAPRLVYGKFLSNSDIEMLIEHQLENCHLNRYSNTLISLESGYIATMSIPILSKWYIADDYKNVGRVPRWSKYHKVLNDKLKELQSQ